MNRDFIQVKTLDGELKLSQKKTDYGITVSTKELVFHKPHLNYYMKFEDIVSIVPFEFKGKRKISFETRSDELTEFASSSVNSNSYKLYVRNATVHNRSGQFQTGRMQFILPLSDSLMKVVAEYSGMNRI
ncbi:hypothetical protein ACFOQM_04585 [Paenibacillus sp. GCM10012307]|uniref:Uncharacterized protein n=1 Tax=Paenibacillus roseus TaxID=2798579 RepID=A0A934J0P4_9BACL|nr:hypothetical protein [Paenibacillus roseus]MBJ6360585.1 hypothetical protein [Paenibacillus roseus]